MKLRYLSLGFLFLAGCATFNKTSTTQPEAPLTTTYPMEFENLPPEQFTTHKTPKKHHAVVAIKQTKNLSTQEQYVGLRGYLNRPPKFTDVRYERAFQRCAPIEITGVYQSGGTIYVYAKQNGFTFPMTGINRRDFVRNASKKLPLLDQYFAKDLSIEETGRQVASVHQKVCSGQTWKDMPQQQFLFVTGDPEFRRPVRNANGQYDVWTYSGPNQSNSRHYYFLSNKLYSWTQ